MQAKLEAAIAGLESGVGEVVIAPGARAGIVGELIGGSAAGTRISS
jgi:acetylglutamate kinase